MSNSRDWRLWRGHLDHVQMPDRAALKREADAEIARIVRCRYGGREPSGQLPRRLSDFRSPTLDDALKAFDAEYGDWQGSARVGVGERRLGDENAHARHGERQAQHGDRSRYGEHGDGVLYTRHGTKLH